MRHKASAAALALLASIQLCTGALLAKPTRTLPRPAHRPIIAEPGPHAARERAAAHAHATSAKHDAPHEIPSARTHHATHTLAEQRSLAAKSAIAAADHTSRHPSRAEEARAKAETRATHLASTHNDSFPKLRETTPPRPPSDGTATGDEPAADNSAAPTSLLLPAPGTQPLKSIAEEASSPVLLPPLRVASLYDSRGRLIVPPPLRGSHEILLHQNEMANRDGDDRVRDDADLLALRSERKLVPLPESEALRVDFRLPENRRFSRPWTATFLTVLAADFYASFHTPLQVDSAVRTVQVQERLMRTNGNAAPAEGDTASPHLTGQAIDIAKGGLTRIQIAWMRTYLQPLIDLGKIDVEEEFQQSCFHISVYKSFLPIAPSHLSVAAARQTSSPSIPERPIE
jgi:hypothetical protein